MRLICPNCDAQYEVDDAVIPEEGRDVQCSNCGHTWFQHPLETAAPAEAAAPAPDETPTAAEAESEVAEPTEPEHPARRELDPSVLGILREEAEREQQARREDAAAETFADQPDLGLDSAIDQAIRPAEPAEEPEDEPETGPEIEPRRDAFPDVEEINSTLSASSDRDAAMGASDVPRSGGFFRGFTLVLVLVALAVGLYVAAPTLSGLSPALEPIMESYVGMVDGWRLWINDAIGGSAAGGAG